MRGFTAVLVGLLALSEAGASPSLESVAELTTQLQQKADLKKKVVTLEEVIAEIGKRHPELRTNYVLMHDSESRQKADYEHPRVISHLQDGRFAMAFNSDPNLPGYHELEMYDFGSRKPAAIPTGLPSTYEDEGFRFRRIIFSSHEAPAKPDVRPINEETCQGCHGRGDLRPNWESYSIWEGAYPSKDFPEQGEKYRFGYKSADHAGFDLFYTKQAGRGRFTFLQGLEEQFLVSHTQKPYPRVAPSDYTQKVGYLNYRRLAHRILQSAEYDRYKYAILGALYDCENYENFFPADFEPRRKLAYYIDNSLKLFKADANYYHLKDDETQMGKLRYVLEGRGISMRKWSLSFRRNPYAFVTPGGSLDGFLSSILMSYDKELEPYRVYNLVEDRDYGHTSAFSQPWTGSLRVQTGFICGQLKEKSKATLEVANE